MKDKNSLAVRIRNLIFSAPPTPKLTQEEIDAGPKAITIRFPPDVRKFIECQAENLQCSVQDLVNITMTSVMRATETPYASELELMCDRFLHVFEVHGVSAADIPTVLTGSSIRRSDLMHHDSLVDALTDDVLGRMSELFGVNEQWLKGSATQVVSPAAWYKNIGYVASRITHRTLKGERVRVLFVTRKGSYVDVDEHMRVLETADDDAKNLFPVGVVLEVTKTVNTKSIKTLEVFRSERWNYSRCRNHLKYLKFFCEQVSVPVGGLACESDGFTKLFNGVVCPAGVINDRNTSAWTPGKHWELGGSSSSVYERASQDSAGVGDIVYYERAIMNPASIRDMPAFLRGNMQLAFGELDDESATSVSLSVID